MASSRSLARRVLRAVGHPVLPAAPSRRHAVGRTVENRFDLSELAVLDLEQLRDFPGPGLDGARADRAARRRREIARVARGMIEEREREHEPALTIDRDVATVTDSSDEMQ